MKLCMPLSLGVGLGLSAGMAAGGIPARYVVTDLGDLGGPIAARAVNAGGVAVGNGILANGAYRGFVSSGGVPIALDPAAGFTQSEATDIDDSGRIVELCYSLGRIEPRALLVDGGNIQDLGGFQPRGIDPGGAVLGGRPIVLAGGTLGQEACVWSGGVLSPLPGLAGSEWSAASDGDGGSLLVGWSIPGTGLRPQAVVWVSGGSPALIGGLGGGMSEAIAISESGLVVGVAADAAGSPHAFSCQLTSGGAPGPMEDLGTLGGRYSAAYGVNADGVVVGTSEARAFVHADGEMVDLNDRIDPGSGWELVGAAGINDAGQIVGWGTHNGTHRSAYLLTPACPADLAEPFGVLNIFDIQVFIGLYNGQDAAADLAEPFGVFNIFDLQAYIGLYNLGCP